MSNISAAASLAVPTTAMSNELPIITIAEIPVIDPAYKR